jgi:hypothetical protein
MRLKDPDKFLAETRGRMRNLYSSLSKGVHAEYIIPLEVQFDRQTVVQYLRDSVAAVIQLAAVSHQIPTALCGIKVADVVKKLRLIVRVVSRLFEAHPWAA